MRSILFLLFSLSLLLTLTTALTCTAEDNRRSEKIVNEERVNDDYCDCIINGEDESNTSACGKSGRVWKCVKGGIESEIPVSFLKDGICDCCDGSDEAPGKCSNTCKSELEERITKLKKEMELHLKGEDVKKRYIKQGNQGVKQLDTTVKKLRKEVKVDEEELQAKMYASPRDQQSLQKAYSAFMQKKQYLQTLEKLSSPSSPSPFGPKREFFSLFNQCYDKKINEKNFKGGSFEPVAKDFNFKLCPFQHIVQMDVLDKNAKPTLLGLWEGWDEEEENVMIYTGGDECWNGPNRVVRVKLVCGSIEELIDVKENGKCTYEFVLSSPAVCSKKHADKIKKLIQTLSPAAEPTETVHDEL